eukprot:SAG22_NODE_1029_length_5939_cov_46.559589_5_plen_235_part_00
MLGGDGTLLHMAKLFSATPPPPVISFSMGTLGFLTPFDVTKYKEILGQVLRGHQEGSNVWCTLRTRMRCEVVVDGKVSMVTYVLNECAVDNDAVRGGLCHLETLVDDHHVTTVRGDGLVISTPSGSTAYNLSAGGAMVAPSVPCTLLTPIAPHSLSSRPFIVPETSAIEIRLGPASRQGARATFDGAESVSLARGSSVRLRTSQWPLPFINLAQYDSDWFDSLSAKLHWNNTAV